MISGGSLTMSTDLEICWRLLMNWGRWSSDSSLGEFSGFCGLKCDSKWVSRLWVGQDASMGLRVVVWSFARWNRFWRFLFMAKLLIFYASRRKYSFLLWHKGGVAIIGKVSLNIFRTSKVEDNKQNWKVFILLYKKLVICLFRFNSSFFLGNIICM